MNYMRSTLRTYEPRPPPFNRAAACNKGNNDVEDAHHSVHDSNKGRSNSVDDVHGTTSYRAGDVLNLYE